MKRVLCILILSLITISLAQAHDVQLITQHLDIKKQKDTGWQQDVLARIVLNKKVEVGAQGTYMERFNVYDKRVGAFVGLHPTDRLFVEVKYLQGMGNKLMPEKMTQLLAYYTLGPGYSAFTTLRNSRYAFTNLNTANFGIEIEKIPSLILIPGFMIGTATFKSPAETKYVHNYGLRVVFYREKNFSLFGFGYKGKEAAQGITGVSNLLVTTTTGGAGAGYYFNKDFRGELIVDHTDYREINNQFVTTTLILTYFF